MRVATYTRISTDEDHQPYSLEAQAERLGNYVASQGGWELVGKFTDQASGATTERPGLQRALSEAKASRFDLLLVYRVDRFARSVRGLAQLLEELDAAGVAFRSATEPFDTTTPAGKMMVQMLGVFAEFERATIVDRVIAGMERKAARVAGAEGHGPSATSDYLLAGLIICARCGKHFVGNSAVGARYRYRYYTCGTRQRYGTKHCDAERLPADELDAAVLDALRRTYERSDLVERAVLAARERAEGMRDQHVQELAFTDTEAAKAERGHRALPRCLRVRNPVRGPMWCPPRQARYQDRRSALSPRGAACRHGPGLG